MCCEKMNKYKCSNLCARCQERKCGCHLCPYEEYEDDCNCQKKENYDCPQYDDCFKQNCCD